MEELELGVEEAEGLALVQPGYSPEVLRGGQYREIAVQVKPAPEQLRDKAFTLRPILKYRSRSGETLENRDFALPIRIGSAEAFENIPNPYKGYSGGRSVDDPNMFMGRQDLLDRIAEIVASGPLGQCFVLYGQKRSGKTSVLRQLQRRLGNPNLPVEITVGALDPSEQPNFLVLCLDQMQEHIVTNDSIEMDLDWWPSREAVRQSPLDTFQRTVRELNRRLREIGWHDPRLILLIDEFTYLYEYITEGILPPTFMRNWKAMLQMKLFSAVVVGQDSMPRFKQKYPNEFGVPHDERITYLRVAEARQLAEHPILLEGQSRYRGKAMDRLLSLTAGSPFYLQIFCGRLVRYLNERRAPFITEADIELVGQTLISGEDDLPIERFDPLITAAGESVAEASREIYLQLLTAIARHSDRYAGARLSELPNIESRNRLLKDMQDREVIVTDAEGRISIRVELFANWLRVHSAWSEVE